MARDEQQSSRLAAMTPAEMTESSFEAPDASIEAADAEVADEEADFNPLGEKLSGWSAFECTSGPFDR